MRLGITIRADWLSALLGINILVFVLQISLQLLLSGSVNVQEGQGLLFYLLGALRLDWIVSGEVWRMLTNAFLHADFFHLLFNMLVLAQIGRLVYEYYGGKLLLVFYVFTGVGASLLSLIFVPFVASVGASGAVFGLIGVLLAGSIRRQRYGVDLPFSPMTILPLVIYSFLIGLTPGLNINNWAHLGGLLAGIGLGFIFNHKLSSNRNPQLAQLENIAYWFSVIVLGVSFLALAANFMLLIFQ